MPHLSRLAALYQTVWYPSGGSSNYNTRRRQQDSNGMHSCCSICRWMMKPSNSSIGAADINNDNSQIVLGSTFADNKETNHIGGINHHVSSRHNNINNNDNDDETAMNQPGGTTTFQYPTINNNNVSTTQKEKNNDSKLTVADMMNDRNSKQSSTGEWIEFKFVSDVSSVSQEKHNNT
jgi:hypothetical protein